MDILRKEVIDLLSEEGEDDFRQRTLKTSLGFKSAWLLLAEALREVKESQEYGAWGYEAFTEYCQQELQLNRGMVKKLLEGLSWIEKEAPEFKPSPQNRSGSTNLAHPVPDPEMIAVLSRGMRESEEKRLPYERYVEIRDAALSGERSLSRVRQELREAVHEEIREAEYDPVKHVKRALTEVEKVLNKWGEECPDGERVVRIRAVRDGL